MKEVAAACKSAAEEYDHDNAIKLILSLPPMCSLLRHRSMLIHLQDTLKSVPKDDPILLRQGAKFALGFTIESTIGVKFDPESCFFSNVYFFHPDSSAETAFATATAENRQHKKRKTTIPFELFPSWMDRDVATVEKAVNKMSDATFRENVPVPPKNSSTFVKFEVKCSTTDTLLYGRYLKFARDISQSPWRAESETSAKKWVKTSVEDVIKPTIMEAFRSEQVTFIPAGREDVDVRMLGTGRPFVLRCCGGKLVPSRGTVDLLKKLQEKINALGEGQVQIIDLQLTDKKHVEWLKSVEVHKRKTYACLVWVERKVTKEDLAALKDLQGVTVKQRTPIRVLHRRTAAVRDKKVYEVRTRVINDHYFIAEVDAEAGTYIKELVHGDFGRTVPSFQSIFACNVDIARLDVVGIDLSTTAE